MKRLVLLVGPAVLGAWLGGIAAAETGTESNTPFRSKISPALRAQMDADGFARVIVMTAEPIAMSSTVEADSSAGLSTHAQGGARNVEVEPSIAGAGIAVESAVGELWTEGRALAPGSLVPASLADLLREFSGRGPEGDRVEVEWGFSGVHAVVVTGGANALNRIAAHPDVLSLEPDLPGGAQLSQTNRVTGLRDLRLQGVTGQGATVALIDTGVDRLHEDLGGDIVAERCFCSTGGGCCPNGSSEQAGQGAAQDANGHGTHVAGIVTSGGQVSPFGAAPDTKIVAVRVMDAEGRFCCLSDVIKALDWVAAERPDVDVVNLSLSTDSLFAGDCDGESGVGALASAINTLVARGTVVVGASGNQVSSTRMTAPACVASVLSVGASWDKDVGARDTGPCTDSTTALDQMACFSNRNAQTDLFAPGALVRSTRLGGGSEVQFGTSHATAVVSGCVSALLQVAPDATPTAIEQALEASLFTVTDPVRARIFPRLDCESALLRLQPTTTSTTTTTTLVEVDVCGDANGDGQLTSSDALKVLRASVDLDGDCPFFRCDIDGNGVISASDALDVLKLSVSSPVLLACPDPA